jgi:hypothetical protein
VNKVFALAGAIALSIIPTPTFSGEVEQKEIMSVTEQLLPQIGEKYKNLDIKEKKEYKEALINYLEYVQKTGVTGVGEFLSGVDLEVLTKGNPRFRTMDFQDRNGDGIDDRDQSLEELYPSFFGW